MKAFSLLAAKAMDGSVFFTVVGPGGKISKALPKEELKPQGQYGLHRQIESFELLGFAGMIVRGS